MVGTARAGDPGPRRARACGRGRGTALALGLVLLTGCADAATSAPGAASRSSSSTAGGDPAPAPTRPGPAAGALGEQDAEVGSTHDPSPRVGSLVEDFPVDLLPVPEDAVLLVTSAAPVGGSEVREVSLNLRTGLTVRDVMALYRDVLLGAGFEEVGAPVDESGPAADATFTRSGGDELVTIGVVDVDGARTLTLGGRVRTDAA